MEGGDENLPVKVSGIGGALYSPIALLMLRLTRKNTYSFMALSKEAKKHRELKLKQEKKSTWILIGSFILSVLAGIVASFSFNWIVK